MMRSIILNNTNVSNVDTLQDININKHTISEFHHVDPINQGSNPNNEQLLYKLMRYNFECKDYRESILCAEQLIVDNAEDVSLWKNKATCHYALGEYQYAVKCYDEIIKLMPNSQENVYTKGIYLYLDKQYQESINSFKIAMTLGLNDVNILYNCAMAHFKLNDFVEALALLNKIVDTEECLVKITNIKGICYMKLGKTDIALNEFNKILLLEPNNKDVWQYKAQCHLALDQGDKFLECYAELCQISPYDTLITQIQGLLHMQNNAYHDALLFFDKVIKLAPTNKNAWYNKAKCHLSLKEYDNVLKCYNHILSNISNKDIQAWHGLIDCYTALNNYSQVLKSCDYVIANIDPYSTKAWVGKSNCYIYLNDIGEALRCIKNAVEINPNDCNQLKLEAMCHGYLSEYDKGIECYNKIIALEPYNVDVIMDKANYHSKLGQHSLVLECYERSLAIEPKNVNIWLQKASYYTKLDIYTQAILCYKAAIEIRDNDPQILHSMAKCYMGLRNYQMALETYNSILQTKSNLCQFVLIDKIDCCIKLKNYDEIIDSLKLIPTSSLHQDKKAIEQLNQMLLFTPEILNLNVDEDKNPITHYLFSIPSGIKGTLQLMNLIQMSDEDRCKIITKVNIVTEYRSNLIGPSDVIQYAKDISTQSGMDLIINELSRVAMLIECDLQDYKLSYLDIRNLKEALHNVETQHGSIMHDSLNHHVLYCFNNKIAKAYGIHDIGEQIIELALLYTDQVDYMGI